MQDSVVTEVMVHHLLACSLFDLHNVNDALQREKGYL